VYVHENRIAQKYAVILRHLVLDTCTRTVRVLVLVLASEVLLVLVTHTQKAVLVESGTSFACVN